MILKVYKITDKIPKSEQFGLTSQIRRAVVSVSANIAEGYERQHRKEYIQFLMIAKGSLGELETYLLLLKDLNYISGDEYDVLNSRRVEVGRVLNGLIKSIKT